MIEIYSIKELRPKGIKVKTWKYGIKMQTKAECYLGSLIVSISFSEKK